jgi:hypothetical protein
MHSQDLVNWELVGYCLDRLDLGPAFRLAGGNIYGRGIWAPCLRYHQGMFYVFSNVPLGQTITLTSGADGSFLAVDTQNHALVTIAADAAGGVPETAEFQVVDLGKGRVALKAADGQFVSTAGEAAVLKDLAGANPGDAESFQWINLMRGDTMLMSLTNHRYLTTRANNAGPVTVTAVGPTPARQGGECFKWEVVRGRSSSR